MRGKVDSIAIAALTRALQKAEPKFVAALARHGVTSPDQLSPEVAGQIFQDVLLQAAAENFPDARLDVLKHGLSAFQHPRFGPAFTRVKAQVASPSDAFAIASGSDAAIVLAAFGLPVAPFDRKRPQILADPSNVIDEVAEAFSKWKTAYVGYSPCDVPFYMLLTDCVQTMRSQILLRPELREARLLLERAGAELTQEPLPSFQHGIVLIPRKSVDTVPTVFLSNPNQHEGSVALYAGWTINGDRDGAPNNGFVPVPLQFLKAALQDPEIAMWVWKPTCVRTTLN